MNDTQFLGFILLFVGWTILGVIRESMYRREGNIDFAIAWGIIATGSMLAAVYVMAQWRGLI